MNINIETRWGAFAIHLAISVLVLIILLCVIFFIWFPYDLIFAGGIGGLKILTGVDIVLGPLLTLIVFNKTKKSLKMDLTLIGLFQAACLAGGLWLIYNERPLTQALAEDGIYLHTKSEYKFHEVEVPDLPGRNPKYVLVDLPQDLNEIVQTAIASEFTGSAPLNLRTDLFLLMHEQSEQSYRKRIDLIRKLLTEKQLGILDELPEEDCDWLPVHSLHVTGHACVTYADGVVKLSNREF